MDPISRQEVVDLIEQHGKAQHEVMRDLARQVTAGFELVNDEVNRALRELSVWIVAVAEAQGSSQAANGNVVTLRFDPTMSAPTRRIIERDENGNIAAIVEQPSEAATG